VAWRWPQYDQCFNLFGEEDKSVKFLETLAPFFCKDENLIVIRLDMNERTVSFDLNDEFVVRARNLNPNVSFRLAVSMRWIRNSVEIIESFFE